MKKNGLSKGTNELDDYSTDASDASDAYGDVYGDVYGESSGERIPPYNPAPVHYEKGFCNSRYTLFGLFGAFSFAAIVASFMLTIDYIFIILNPNSGIKLECDINSVISCTDVAKSWQATLLHLGDKPIPNSLIGAVGYAVFITIAVLGLSRCRMPKWFMFAANLGTLVATIFSYWLLTQSMFAIKALCPWCITLMFSTTIMLIALTKWNVLEDNLYVPDGAKRFLQMLIRTKIDIIISALWVFILIVVIVLDYRSLIFGL